MMEHAAKAGSRSFSTPGYLIAGGDKPGAIDTILCHITRYQNNGNDP